MTASTWWAACGLVGYFTLIVSGTLLGATVGTYLGGHLRDRSRRKSRNHVTIEPWPCEQWTREEPHGKHLHTSPDGDAAMCPGWMP